MGILKLKGTGRLMVMPDQVKVSGRLKALSKNNYEEAVSQLAKKVNAMTGLSVADKKVQYTTESFNVDIETEYTNSKRFFVGYKATYRINIILENNRELINELLIQLIPLLEEDSLEMNAEIGNPGQYQQKAIELAIADAQRKAEIICNASGQKAGEILAIFYNVKDFDESDYIVATKHEVSASKSLGEIAIQSEEIAITEHVIIEWDIR